VARGTSGIKEWRGNGKREEEEKERRKDIEGKRREEEAAHHRNCQKSAHVT